MPDSAPDTLDSSDPHSGKTISARWRLDRAYYRKMWDDLITHRLRFRKWCIPLGVALAVLGVSLLLGAESRLGFRFGILASAFGGIHIAWHFWDKARWFRLVDVGGDGDDVLLEFRANRIYQRGPTGEGNFTWRAVQNVTRGDDGIFLGLQRGLSIYVPSSAFARSGEQDVIEEWFRESRTSS